MRQDHYKVLGVQPDAEEVVIRAAYLALMRRYHPDQNASQAALQKSQLVSAAFSELSNPERRKAYDKAWSRQHIVPPSASTKPRRKGTKTRNASLLIAAATLVLLGFVATRTSPGGMVQQASNPAAEAGATVLASGPNTNDCAARVDPAAVRRAVFAEAARLGSVDRSALRHAAVASMIRVSNIEANEDNALGRWTCSAIVAVELPSGTVTAGGQSRIVADLRYTVVRAPGDERQHVSVPHGELIAISLAAVRRTTFVPPLPVLAAIDDIPKAGLAPIVRTIAPPAKPLPQPQLPPRKPARNDVVPAQPTSLAPKPPPSENASTPKPAAPAQRPAPKVNLAYLNHLSGMLYDQSFLNADAAKRSRLTRTRAEFAARLNGCSTDECRKSAYLKRNVEIVSIMRSQPS